MKTAAILLFLSLVSCVAQPARENVLLPAMRLAWTGISEEIEAGLNDAHAKGELSSVELGDLLNKRSAFAMALDAGEASAVPLAHWDTLKPYADRGVQAMLAAGEIEQAAVPLFIERRMRFDAAMLVLHQLQPVSMRAPARELRAAA